MKQIEWNDGYKIDVDILDDAHQRLFAIVHKLIRLSENKRKSKWACTEGVKYFKGYTLRHFAEEEAYMRSINYSGYEMHKKLHDNLRNTTLTALEIDLERSDYSKESVCRFLGFCLDWLSNHILIEDRAITGKATGKWVREQSDEEILAFSQAVRCGFEKDFLMNTRVVSRYYSGEDIGKASYYRLFYKTKDGEVLQIYLAYEESLLLNLAGQLLNERYFTMNKTVLEALSPLSRQLAEHVGGYLQSVELDQPEKENVLTYGQFLQAFETEYPSYSMLFDTDAGFFAVCVEK